MKIKLLVLLTSLPLLFSCTENQRAKRFGGTMQIGLPPNYKLENVTWKNEQMWYLTRPMRVDEKAEIYQFQEKSSFGLVEGSVIFTESKQ